MAATKKTLISIEDFDKKLNDLGFDIFTEGAFLNNVVPTPLNIAMMTMGIWTGKSIKLGAFDKEFVTCMQNASPRMEFVSVSGVDPTPPSRFTNAQIVKLKLDGYKKYAIVFEHGAIQVMGCKSAHDIVLIATTILGALGIEYECLKAERCIDIRLITCNFQYADCSFRLHNLHAALLAEHKSTWFDPMRSPGVQLPLMIGEKKVAVIVFNNGKVVITGANSLEQVQHAWSLISNFIDTHFDSFAVKQSSQLSQSLQPLGEDASVKKRGRKRKAVLMSQIDNFLAP